MKAYLFPGQGSQHVGMGKALYDHSAEARQLFQKANQLLDMELTQLMFQGAEDALKETLVAQSAIFVCSTIMAKLANIVPPMAVAGHSLGEISALVTAQVITFEQGLQLVAIRSKAMQACCKLIPGTMAAVIGLEDQLVQNICAAITAEIVVAANYNCPGQLVISGTQAGVALASKALIAAGALKVIPLKVAGAFHSPLMKHAQEVFKSALDAMPFATAICPVYQNITGLPVTDPIIIKQQLLEQLVSPVYWTATINHMAKNGVTEYVECGPGHVLQKLVRKINPMATVSSLMIG